MQYSGHARTGTTGNHPSAVQIYHCFFLPPKGSTNREQRGTCEGLLLHSVVHTGAHTHYNCHNARAAGQQDKRFRLTSVREKWLKTCLRTMQMGFNLVFLSPFQHFRCLWPECPDRGKRGAVRFFFFVHCPLLSSLLQVIPSSLLPFASGRKQSTINHATVGKGVLTGRTRSARKLEYFPPYSSSSRYHKHNPGMGWNSRSSGFKCH